MSGSADDREAKLAEYDEHVAKFSEATTLEDRDELAWALLSRGAALRELGREKEALASFEEVVSRFDGASEVELQARVAVALGRGADVLLELKRPEEAVAACDAALSRFAGNSDARFRPSISFALRLRGRALLNLGRVWEAAEAYQQYVRDFSPPEPAALYGLAECLTQLGRCEEALPAIDAYLAAVSESAEPVEPRWPAYLLLVKARHLIALGEFQEARASCEKVIDLLRGIASERNLREYLAGALLRRAAILALEGETQEVDLAVAEIEELRHEDERLLVNFEPAELEALQQGLERLSDDSEVGAGEREFVTLEGEAGNVYGIEFVDFRNIPDDPGDLE